MRRASLLLFVLTVAVAGALGACAGSGVKQRAQGAGDTTIGSPAGNDAVTPAAPDAGTPGGTLPVPGRAAVRWRTLGETAYVAPSELPAGWALRVATERTGRPATDWDTRWDAWATEDRRRLLTVLAREGDGTTSAASGQIQDIPTSGLVLGLSSRVPKAGLGWVPGVESARALTVTRGPLFFLVAEISENPDDGLLRDVAAELVDAPALDFGVADAARAQGFELVGTGPQDMLDVPDYTISWAPKHLVGADREEAVGLPDEGPRMWVNAGGRFYGQGRAGIPDDPATAPVEHESGFLQIRFRLGASVVSVGGADVSDDMLRDFAESLVALPRSEWRDHLGSRLLVDPPYR